MFKLTASLPDRILVVIDISLDKTESGLILGDSSASDRQCMARVLGAHPDDPVHDVGDTVIISRNAGTLVEGLELTEGLELRTVLLKEVYCKFEMIEEQAS